MKADAEKKDAEKPKADADEKAKEKPEKPAPPRVTAYSRLYFDVNHNGDLSDDKVVEAIAQPAPSFPASMSRFPSRGSI